MNDDGPVAERQRLRLEEVLAKVAHLLGRQRRETIVEKRRAQRHTLDVARVQIDVRDVRHRRVQRHNGQIAKRVRDIERHARIHHIGQLLARQVIKQNRVGTVHFARLPHLVSRIRRLLPATIANRRIRRRVAGNIDRHRSTDNQLESEIREPRMCYDRPQTSTIYSNKILQCTKYANVFFSAAKPKFFVSKKKPTKKNQKKKIICIRTSTIAPNLETVSAVLSVGTVNGSQKSASAQARML